MDKRYSCIKILNKFLHDGFTLQDGGKSRQARSEGATCSHPSRASARTKDDVCDDDKVAVMPVPTCESLTLKRVEINAVKAETTRSTLQSWQSQTAGLHPW